MVRQLSARAQVIVAAAATCGFFKNEWVLRSPVHALCRDPAEFDYARPRARMQL